MKRINFAWQEFWYGFDTYEEAEKFIEYANSKNWTVLYYGGTKIHMFDENDFEVRVRKPIKGYNMGN